MQLCVSCSAPNALVPAQPPQCFFPPLSVFDLAHSPRFDAQEAHGGGTIGGVASMLLATAMNTKGKPKPAMWEGILPVSGELASPTPGGWQQVEAPDAN